MPGADFDLKPSLSLGGRKSEAVVGGRTRITPVAFLLDGARPCRLGGAHTYLRMALRPRSLHHADLLSPEESAFFGCWESGKFATLYTDTVGSLTAKQEGETSFIV